MMNRDDSENMREKRDWTWLRVYGKKAEDTHVSVRGETMDGEEPPCAH